MVPGEYLVERRCDGQTLEQSSIFYEDDSGSPRKALDAALVFGAMCVRYFDPREDYFRVTDPAGAEWYWHYRDGKLVRLLRPPVAPGSLPPSP